MGPVVSESCCSERREQHKRPSSLLKGQGLQRDHKSLAIQPRQVNRRQGQGGEMDNVSIRDFVLISVLGRGAFGKVMLTTNKLTGQVVAIKQIKKKVIEDNLQVDNVLTEKKVMQIADHPFIVKLLYSFQSEGSIYLGMEYLPGGELFHHLRKMKKFDEQGAKFYASELLLALEYLHDELGVIYRDLKPENILLDAEGHIKLTDFGLAKKHEEASTFCGTPEYFAPEIITSGGYGKEVDWWSFGCFLYELMVGRTPFVSKCRNKLFQLILAAKVIYPDSMSPDARDLISKLLHPNAEERFGAADVKNHPFFKDINWEDVMAKKMKPPFSPKVVGDFDVQNFDKTFTDERAKQSLVIPGEMDYPDFMFVRTASSLGELYESQTSRPTDTVE